MAPVNTQLWSVGGTRWGCNDVRDCSDDTVLISFEWHCIEYMTTWDYRWKVGRNYHLLRLEAVSTLLGGSVSLHFLRFSPSFLVFLRFEPENNLFNGTSYLVSLCFHPNFVGFQRTPNWFWAWRKPKSTSAASKNLLDSEHYLIFFWWKMIGLGQNQAKMFFFWIFFMFCLPSHWGLFRLV